MNTSRNIFAVMLISGETASCMLEAPAKMSFAPRSTDPRLLNLIMFLGHRPLMKQKNENQGENGPAAKAMGHNYRGRDVSCVKGCTRQN